MVAVGNAMTLPSPNDPNPSAASVPGAMAPATRKRAHPAWMAALTTRCTRRPTWRRTCLTAESVPRPGGYDGRPAAGEPDAGPHPGPAVSLPGLGSVAWASMDPAPVTDRFEPGAADVAGGAAVAAVAPAAGGGCPFPHQALAAPTVS